MKDNLRLILLVVGVIAIAALLIHGIWSSRKERSSLFGKSSKTKNRERQQKRDEYEEIEDEQLDVLPNNFNMGLDDEPEKDFDRQNHHAPATFSDSVHNKQDEFDASTEGINFANSQDEENQFDSNDFANTHDASLAETTEYEITQDTTTPAEEDEYVQTEVEEEAGNDELSNSQKSPAAIPQLMIVFHILGINDNPLRGDLLLNSFLNAGLHFGKMNIFHRHLSTPSTPVIFSIANMVKPGIFEPNTMSEFNTPGITCFMVLPCVGQPQQNFKLMLQTVQRIADDVGGNVYDENRRLITPQKIEEYRFLIRKWIDENSEHA